MQSLELASIVFLDTHLLANIVCTCKHCTFINQIFMRISRHIKKNSNSQQYSMLYTILKHIGNSSPKYIDS